MHGNALGLLDQQVFVGIGALPVTCMGLWILCVLPLHACHDLNHSLPCQCCGDIISFTCFLLIICMLLCMGTTVWLPTLPATLAYRLAVPYSVCTLFAYAVSASGHSVACLM